MSELICKDIINCTLGGNQLKSLWHGDKLIWPYLPGLLFHSEDPNNTLIFQNKLDGESGEAKVVKLWYSIDGETWTPFTVPVDAVNLRLQDPSGNEIHSKDIYLRGMNPDGLSNVYPEEGSGFALGQKPGSFHIQPTCETAARGNVQWIINCDNPDSIVPPNCDPITGAGGSLQGLFYGATKLTDITELRFPYKQTQYMLYKHIFAGSGIKSCPQSVFSACLSNPECDTIETHAFDCAFRDCKSLQSVGLNFYNIKHIKASGCASLLCGVNNPTLVYDAFKNLETIEYSAFISGADSSKLTRFYDIPRVWTRDMGGATTTYNFAFASLYLNDSSANYLKFLSDTHTANAGITQGMTYGVSSGGTFVKYWNGQYYSGTAGIPSSWTVISCKPFYETASGVDEYCLADGANDTTWHEDRRCDEYGNLL